MRVDFVEEMVMNPDPVYKGWRHFRLEYDDGKLGSVWIPPGLRDGGLSIMDKIQKILSS